LDKFKTALTDGKLLPINLRLIIGADISLLTHRLCESFEVTHSVVKNSAR
jgi:hypothetical protein